MEQNMDVSIHHTYIIFINILMFFFILILVLLVRLWW